MPFDINTILVSPDHSVREAIERMDRTAKRIILAVDSQRCLLGTITDGDLRRAMLAGVDLDTSVEGLLAIKKKLSYSHPITAPVATHTDILIKLMQEHGVHQIPLLGSDEKVVGLVILDDLLPQIDLPVQAVVMAGGQGKRLRPLTEDMPKPMLPVGGRPVMEHVLEQLMQAGIRQVNVTTHYKPEKIIEHFGDGQSFGVELNYVNEDKPMGTGGALGLIPKPNEPMLVINGDILTQVNLRAMLGFHQEHQADLTVAVRHYEMQLPYGVVECDGPHIQAVREKPQIGFFVNAGIYLIEPTAYQYIPNGEHFDMTDLIQWLLEAKKTVVSFPVREYWLDIGQHDDYNQAQLDMAGKDLDV